MNNDISRRGRFIASAAAALIFLAGCGSTSGPAPQSVPPESAAVSSSSVAAPPTSAGAPAQTPTQAAAPVEPAAAVPETVGPALPASQPVALDIPDITVSSQLLQLGKAADGTAEVPPGEPGSPAGWYKYSPTPGEIGPSVILGHVNSTLSNIGVFYRLHEMTQGQQFSVSRADGTVAVFAMDRSAVFKKDQFPTLEVYGNTKRAEIRLITCGGYNPSTNLYDDNTVVYGHLVSSHPA
ncbi:class F sortase [Paenarthrobacter sp. PH39-S1]|uniref:class F sortase n=1 Tax=Paenarthrobacter sp. PH39-S1 TaxID=3046204 RepID=UPI0024BA70BC|nr:class F sortase [Paenarthrobacter sp. PH39-S1]MDJ0357637.1 class F sortase [Paenarthrobacter sp. PH39-S1]